MMYEFIVIMAIALVIGLWTIFTQRKLVVLDDNIDKVMSQIGVQISSCFDALTTILNLSKDYAKDESEILIETIKSRRSVITAKSNPQDVIFQEAIISETLEWIAMVTEKYPELKENQTYIKAMEAIQTIESMVRNSHTIYNYSVTKLNRKNQIFPISVIAGMLGFRKREYLMKQV